MSKTGKIISSSSVGVAFCLGLTLLILFHHDRKATPAHSVVAKIVRVIDGDTFIAEVSGKVEKIRICDIDCPEMDDLYGPIAREYLAIKIIGNDVRVVPKGRDKYGRLLAEVFIPTGSTTFPWLNVGKDMLVNKMAVPYKKR